MARVKPIYSNTFTKRRKVAVVALIVCVIVALAGGIAWLQLRNPRPNARNYPVLGLRISQSDGSQDYTSLHKQGVDFVYLKATEGASYFDDNFETNYSQASGAGMRLGVYHYFSFTSAPAKQAASFMEHVGENTGDLPIGIEVAAYTKVPDDAKLRQQLTTFIADLRQHYTQQILLIGTPDMLSKVQTVSPDAPRMVVSDKQRAGKQGTFWQYASDAKLPGGKTRYHCVVLVGTKAAFQQLGN
ncbi:GH25 family lysozyme [Lacticaseibacillus hulanensis]|uniref:GH25 family lysozyme n=1 Tax=Lacticaseibacillus hulanensis TaxID=2493111 RepID=UPI0013E36120|nr:GH25 family lysozyme [Lacticaseibacillus hulanensis]